MRLTCVTLFALVCVLPMPVTASNNSGIVRGRLHVAAPVEPGVPKLETLAMRVELHGRYDDQVTYSDAQGHFQFMQVHPGNYFIYAHAASWSNYCSQLFRVSANEISESSIELDPPIYVDCYQANQRLNPLITNDLYEWDSDPG